MRRPARFPEADRRLARYRTSIATFPDWLKLRTLATVKSRHRPGSVRLAGHRVQYPDLHAVMAQFHDIFRQRIYHFETANAAPRIVDAGGFVGMSALFFKGVYPDARIDTYEPDPELVALIRDNLQRNGIAGVTVHEAAVAESTGTAGFVSDGADGGTVTTGDGSERDVRTIALGEVIDGPVDFLKLDVEGSELPALRGAGERLRQVDQLVLEYHGGTERSSQDLGELLELLDAQGFRYLVNHADYFVNPLVRPPFRLQDEMPWTALVYARRRH